MQKETNQREGIKEQRGCYLWRKIEHGSDQADGSRARCSSVSHVALWPWKPSETNKVIGLLDRPNYTIKLLGLIHGGLMVRYIDYALVEFGSHLEPNDVP